MNAIVQDFPLPELREDLQLLEGPCASDGSPSWNIFDSIRNRYFRIGWPAFQLLSRWSVGTVNKLIKIITEETTFRVTENDVDDLIKFLYANSLTVSSPNNNSQDYVEQYQSTKKNWLVWLIQNYLFVRIPLVKPNQFLQSTIQYIEPIFSKKVAYCILSLGLIGFYLVAREWDTFVTSFLYFFNFSGFFAYVVTLVFIKILHELGHAYTATRYGCKVSTMGVAFLVMFPVLYTDTSDAWKLTSRKKRLHIGIAGITVEMYIASIATFVWAFLPDGILKSMAFLLATSSWLLSLSINLNPFMRFDGYYILSDLWGIENLQTRAFEFGRWKIRELLFALNKPAPEKLQSHTINKLVLYAWGTWIYRFFLFLGIALLVYYFFFKVLGIILFITEIVWFILMPVFKEIKNWWGMRTEIIHSKRFYFVLLIFIGSLILLFIPWDTKITVPAILESKENIVVYSPVRAKIKSILVSKGQVVEKDQLLLSLESPVLNEELDKVSKQIEYIQLRLKRLAASREDLANIHVILSKLEKLNSKQEGLIKQSRLLEIYSPIKGKLISISNNLHAGLWINQKTALFNIIDDSEQHIVAMISESDIFRVQKQQDAIFYPDDPERKSIRAEIIEIEQSNIKNLKEPYFIFKYGGDIVIREKSDGTSVPESGIYRVILQPKGSNSEFEFVIKGVVRVEGDVKSIFQRASDLIAAVFIRESGF